MEAVAQRIGALRPALRRSASAILRADEDIEDAVQEALLRLVAYVKKEKFDPERGTLLALGRTTVRRVALDMQARKRPHSAGDAVDPAAPETAAPLEEGEVRGRLREALGGLPDPQRTAFLLVFQEGLAHAEAARELGISVESLRARLYRARGGLRKALKEFLP